MTRILAIGMDTDLLLTRALVLRRTGAEVDACLLGPALERLETDFYDIVVLCHTLPEESSIRICRIMELFWPESRVILIGRSDFSPCLLSPRSPGVTAVPRPNPAKLLDLSLNLLQGAAPQPRALSAVIPYTAV